MCRVTVIILHAFVIQAKKTLLKASTFHRAGLDNATLGKVGYLATPARTNLRPALPFSTHPHGHFASPWAGYQPQLHRRPTPVRSALISYRPQVHRVVTPRHRTQVLVGAAAFFSASPFIASSAIVKAILKILQTKKIGFFMGNLMTTKKFTAALTFFKTLIPALLAWYSASAIAYPIITKATTSGVCYAIGDLCAQRIAGANISSIDLGRAGRSGAAGFIGHGPIAHHWIEFLETQLSFGGAWWAVFVKVAVNQPMNIMYNTIYSFVIGALTFQDPRVTMRNVWIAAWPAFLASIRFWPIVNLITFSVIPIQLRVAWVDTVKIIWICILSGVNNEGLHEKKKQEEKKA
eukprot:gnl/MRDRNA2_/MRDRNA2_157159_c0_seq1.p1 gnl/MRDRNA2_/MRDRNA2_157159_c0~~gnl/MRDRNA2_/MRDRNA2_157159_c0_seq1.p1  ORF type:complete len:349 (+),score=23.76 gnl/MRDRNA2_/MRDRNA2_157159_c0_seq1:83-1129(+)